MKRIYIVNNWRQGTLLLFFGLLGMLSAIAQERVSVTIKGNITDNTGAPATGAVVTLDGLVLGATADLDGNYVMIGNLLPGDYKLNVRYVGYGTHSQTITVNSSTAQQTIDVVLRPDALNLGEVVVIGSTLSQERKQLGNQVTTVRGDQMLRRGTGDVIQALQGKVPGVQITQNSGDVGGGGISVRARGAKSVLASSEPLYVIDGVIANNATFNVTNVNVDPGRAVVGQNRMADINPNDIESIDFINGAAAAAIYGSRASNGVVLITTKRGISGKPTITFSTGLNINELRKRVYISTYPKQFHPNNITDPNAPGYINPLTVRLHTITRSQGQLLPHIVDVPGRYDYQDYIFQKGTGTDNNLSVTGGNDRTRYYVSMGYLKNEGIIIHTDFQRYGGRVRLDQKIFDWLDLSAGLNYANSRTQEQQNGNVFWSPINSVNITNNIYKIWERDAAGNLKAAEPTRINPLSIETFDIGAETNRIISDVQLNARLLPGLTLSYILGIDNTTTQGRQYIPPYPYGGVNTLFFNDGYASSAAALAYLFNNDLNLSYKASLGKNFSSLTQAGYSYQFNKTEYTMTQGRRLVPFVQTVNGAGTPLNPAQTRVLSDIQGYFLQETFGYRDRLFLTLAGRIDGSSVFSEDQRNQFYPKASFSYLISDEGFWGNTLGKFIPQFKLRASYGEAGNLTGIGAYDRFYNYTANSFVGRNALNAANALANPSVRPERQRELEGGVDVSFWQNRIGIGLTLYQQRISDLLINRVIAPSQGGTSLTTNIGELSNKGLELSLNATLLQQRDLNWNLFGTFARNRNKVIKTGQSLISIANVLGAPVNIVENAPVGVFYGFYHARNDDGSLLLTPGGLLQREKGTQTTILNPTPGRKDGQPDGAFIRKIIGDPNPDFIWSVGSNFNFKNLQFGFLFDAVTGNEVFNADKRTRQGVGIGDWAEKELKGEIPRGWIDAFYPIEEWRIDDGSFVKLRELSLAYNFPNISKSISNLQINLIGRNLMSWDNYNGYDPETNAGGQSAVLRGTDFGNVPIPRVYQVMLRATF